MKEHNRKNPWLGLASYREGEILYGRDEDIHDLTECVLNDTDTLLYGKSGIGKTSILNAGILPVARFKKYLPVMIRLSHKSKNSYLYQIAEAIKNAMIPIPVDENGIQQKLTEKEHQERESSLRERIREVVPRKNKDIESIYEYFHRHTFHDAKGKRIKLLLIFDQFEEIFTLQNNKGKRKAFFAELADMLNDVMPNNLVNKVEVTEDQQEEVDALKDNNFDNLFDDLDLGSVNGVPNYVTDNIVHFVFTIREDFLSEFEFNTAAIPSLRHNRYRLRPINEEQAYQIITRPVPGLIDNDVAKLIIEKITGKSDFEFDEMPELEIDSAVLSLYLNRLYEAKTDDKITKELVEEKSGSIISEFYDDALKEISNEAVEFIEDKLLTGHGRRNNITMYDAIASGKITEEEIDILCNKKNILRQFNYSGDIRIEFVHDILCPVVKKHKEDRRRLKLLNEQKNKFIEEEKLKRENLKREAAEKEQRFKKQTRKIIVTIFSVVFLIVLVLLWFTDYNNNRRTYSEYYTQFKNTSGWPEGVGKPLTEEQRDTAGLYYELSHIGNKNGGRHTCVNINLRDISLPDSCKKELDWIKIKRFQWFGNNKYNTIAYNYKLNGVKTIKYFADEENNKIVKEEYRDSINKIIMSINYFYITPTEALVLFISPLNKQSTQIDKGFAKIKLTWDSIGNVKSLMYYDTNERANIRITKNMYTVTKRKGRNIRTSEFYKIDESGNITPLTTKINPVSHAVTSYFKRITEYDNNDSIKSLTFKDADDNIIKSMMYFEENGRWMKAVKGIDGNPVRCDKWEEDGRLYYKAFKSGNTALNEWNQPSSMFVDNTYIGDSLSDKEIAYVHVCSAKSKMYNNKNGVIDGDRIIEVGNWKYDKDSLSLDQEWKKALNNKEISIVVLRPNKNSYERRLFTFTLGKDESKYIHYHTMRMTQNEMRSIDNYLHPQNSTEKTQKLSQKIKKQM